MPEPAPKVPCVARRRGGAALLGLVAVVVLGVAVAAPVAAAPVTTVTDSFTRTVSGGWGAANAGGTWSVATASRFSVSGGTGNVSLTTDGVTQRATLPGAGAGVVNELTTTVSVSRLPTSGGLYVAIAGRRVSAGQYQAKIRFRPDGTIGVGLGRLTTGWAETHLVTERTVTGVRGVVGQFVRVRVQVTGTSPTTVRAKVWQATATEPSGWTVTATDSTAGWQVAGGIGLDSYLSRNSASLTARFDNIAGTVDPMTAVVPPPLPPPPPLPLPPPPEGRTLTAGSLPVGSAQYAPPEGAFYVSATDGDDAADGSLATPWRTLATAVATAPSGSTVVLRAGTYVESVLIPTGRRLTVQAYPGEEVWLDGSRLLTDWIPDGTAWRVDGWTPNFDHSPTYTPGAPDGTSSGWRFVDPAYPLAAWPEMVFVDGTALRQVSSRSAVTEGTFYVDSAGDRLYVGSDPTGHEVRATALRTGLTIRGAGSVVRGIGVRRYGTPVPEKGALLSYAADVTIENVVVSDNATQGMYVGGIGLGVRNTLSHVTSERNGMLGIESSYSDGLVLDAVRVVGNNTERFNQAPVSGGVKICSARTLTVTNSVFAANLGTGLWFDESVHGATVVGNDVLQNTGNGISYEISAQAVFADNLIAANRGTGLKINNASRIDVWNNTIVDNVGRPMWVVQDSRVASNTSLPGHDPRQPLPDPTVTWLLGPVTIGNNIVGGATTANCVLCGQDTALRRTPAQIGLTVNGNVWFRPSASAPTLLVTWPAGSTSTRTFTTLALFTAGTGQEVNGLEVTGSVVVDAAYRLTPEATTATAAVPLPLPDWLATLLSSAEVAPWLGARLP